MFDHATVLVAATGEARLALIAGLVSLGLACTLLVVAATVRACRQRTARAADRARQRWLPVFLSALTNRSRFAPPLMSRRDRAAGVEVWNQLMGTVRGDSRRRLRRCGASLGFADHARRAVGRRRGRERLGAVVALGHLRDRASWRALATLLDDPNSGVRLDAARALVRIDEGDALPLLLPRFLDADRWYPAAAVSVLGEAEPAQVSVALADAVHSAGPAGRRQLARVVGGLRSPSSREAIRRLLEEAADDHELLAASLDALAGCGEPADADLVRPLLQHPAWFVRLKAVTALGRLGGPDDLDRLSRLLADREWWVRYRTAQAVVVMPGLGRDRLEQLRNDHPDTYARDVAAHVLAEMEPAT